MTRHRGRGPLAEEADLPIARAVAAALAGAVLVGSGLGYALVEIAEPDPAPIEQHEEAPRR